MEVIAYLWLRETELILKYVTVTCSLFVIYRIYSPRSYRKLYGLFCSLKVSFLSNSIVRDVDVAFKMKTQIVSL